MSERTAVQTARMSAKRVLVTGSDTGIGREVGLEFAREGAHVVFHYAHHVRGATSAADEVKQQHGKAASVYADFREPDAAQHLGQQALEFLGGIDILVNNAGITFNAPIETITAEQFDTVFDVNFRSAYFLTQAVVPAMKTQGAGAIINIASIHGLRGAQGHSVYAGTKGAIVALTRQLAIELAPAGIRVNAIAPGAIEVENYYKAVPDFDPQLFGKYIPIGFVGKPRDIARVAIFLASEDARFIVGQTLVVDGGTTAWFAFSEDFRAPSTSRWGQGYVPGR